jgi:hypothetical protein
MSYRVLKGRYCRSQRMFLRKQRHEPLVQWIVLLLYKLFQGSDRHVGVKKLNTLARSTTVAFSNERVVHFPLRVTFPHELQMCGYK